MLKSFLFLFLFSFALFCFSLLRKTASRPLGQKDGRVSYLINWCFTPSQPAPLYQRTNTTDYIDLYVTQVDETRRSARTTWIVITSDRVCSALSLSRAYPLALLLLICVMYSYLLLDFHNVKVQGVC